MVKFSNIVEVKNVSDLKHIVGKNMTVILGLVLPSTDNKTKVMIRKFLKRKSEKFPLLTFVYMEVSNKDRVSSLNILQGDDDDYPKVYHIRGGNNFFVEVPAATKTKLTKVLKQFKNIIFEK